MIVASVIFVFLINGHQFYPGSGHRILVTRADGSTFLRPGYVVLQSDIITIIGYFATITRTVSAWRLGGILWRSSFLFMDRGGISLEGVGRILEDGHFKPLLPKHLAVKRHFFIFQSLLFARFCLDYASPILSGSVSWTPSLGFVPSDRPFQDIPRNAPGLSLQDYRQNPGTMSEVIATSAAMGDVTWGTTGNNSTMMTRVLQGGDLLPIGSTFQTLTVPFFVVELFQWIKDPNSTLTLQQQTLLFNYAGYSPYITRNGWLGLIPDTAWGPLTNTNMTDPAIVAETRILSIRLNVTSPGGLNNKCDNVDDTIPSDVGRYHYSTSTSEECFVFAQVTYRAGVARCDNCTSVSPAVIQRSASQLTPIPDSLTAEALAIAPYVGTNLMATGWADPPIARTQDHAIEFLSRTYQSAWNALTSTFGERSVATDVHLSVSMTQASVTKWRVWIWVVFHLVAIAVDLVFVAEHRLARHPWVDNPDLAALFLNTEELRGLWGSNDPWRRGDMPDVMLRLADSEGGARRIIVDKQSEEVVT